MIIDEEFKSLIPALKDEEYNGLEQSILAEGCRDALVCWGDILIDGHNRYKICLEHNVSFDTVQKEFADRNEALLWIIDNQLSRRNINAYERTRLALQKEPLIAAIAKGNQGTRTDICQISDKSSIDTKKELAKIANVSHDTVAKVKKIEAKATPELKEQLRNGDISINQAYKQVKRVEKENAREEVRQVNTEKVHALNNPLEAQGLFQTIVIDPAWDWGDEGDINQFGRAKPDYHTMPINEIEALPVGKITDENCHLYLWVTNRSLPKAFHLIETWGFRYITCLTWVKPSFGMGNYFRGSTEQVLFAVKGSQGLRRHDVGTYFAAPRGDKHSAKPDEFYTLVESCSYGPYIDIFGRKERNGWSVWGENS